MKSATLLLTVSLAATVPIHATVIRNEPAFKKQKILGNDDEPIVVGKRFYWFEVGYFKLLAPTIQNQFVKNKHSDVGSENIDFEFNYDVILGGLNSALPEKDAYEAISGQVLSTPAAIPEPGSVGLMGLGIVGLAFASRRRAN